MTPIIFYLKDERLSEGKDEARKLRIQSTRCVLLDEANYVLREVHEGACGNHSGARSLIHKVVREGYYWPTVQADAKAYVKVCDQCQRFSNVPRQASE